MIIRINRRQDAFTMIEVMLALIVFLMMTLVFAAVFPVTLCAAKSSNNYNQAVQVVQHKLDELTAAGVTKITDSGNVLETTGVIDTPIVSEPDASSIYHFTFTGVDNIASTGANTGYFPPGSSGTIAVQDYNAFVTAAGGTTNVPIGAAMWVTVAVNWTGAGALTSGSYSASTMVVKMTHN